MTPDLVRFIQNSQAALRSFTAEQLYQLAVSLRHELARRDLPARCEAAALELALLVDAQAQRAAIYSADCSDDGPRWLTPDGEWVKAQLPASWPAEKS